MYFNYYYVLLSAAVPSKRDLQALTRAIQSEFIIAVTESEAGLVLIICKEFLKIVRLMLTKIEGMVINSPETRKISVTNNFLRTQQQEHNGQLVALLIQFRDALERIPSQVMKYAIDNSSINYETTLRNGHNKSGITNNNYNNCHSNYSDKTATSFATITKAMNESVLVAINEIEELCQKQVLSGIIDVLANYITSQLLSIHKEGVVTVLAPKNISTGSTDMEESSIECSTALQSVTKQLPTIIRVHLQSLPKCELVEKAIEEICLRTINSYVSISALLRPVNEQTRLRTAKDLSALEMLLSGISTRLFSVSDCPIVQEFR